jgi:hypothetical protein
MGLGAVLGAVDFDDTAVGPVVLPSNDSRRTTLLNGPARVHDSGLLAAPAKRTVVLYPGAVGVASKNTLGWAVGLPAFSDAR